MPGRARLAATAGPPPEPEGRRRLRALAANARNSLDALALIWFVVGNVAARFRTINNATVESATTLVGLQCTSPM